MIMYHGIPKMANDTDLAEKWSANLAGSLSQRIRDVYVLGLSGISFPLSRMTSVLGKDLEGYSPKALMADRFVYFNGKEAKLP